ncbi:MAG: hypothetical protein VYC34_04925, partial [Planctomycetota bacterium]|nr:hypothetical protein [Planctomycetota bacterium]
GSDQLFGEGQDDYIDPGPGRDDRVVFGSGEGPIPSDFIPPADTPNPAVLAQNPINFAAPTERFGAPGAAQRWGEFFASASNLGLSGNENESIEPDVYADSNGVQHIVWADSRRGAFQIYYLQRLPDGSVVELGDSARNGGVSETLNPARRPSVTVDDTGAPIIAWTEQNGTTSDIFVARWDGAAWVILGGASASQTGGADNASIHFADGSPILTWLDSSSGVTNVFAKRFDGANWVELAAGSASGDGLSDSLTDVSDLATATNGTDVAIAWSQQVGATSQIYLVEFQGAADTITGLGGSNAGNGLSNTLGDSAQPSLAYHQGDLFVAWQDDSAGTTEIYVRRFNGLVFVQAGPNAATLGGVSRPGLMSPPVDPNVPGGPTLVTPFDQASEPRLASTGADLHLLFFSADTRDLTDTHALYSLIWDGAQFIEELPGEASANGVSETGGLSRDLAVSASESGVYAAWTDSESGASSEILLRGDEFDLNNVTNVNSTATLNAALAAATAGDIIVLAPGDYAGAINFNTPGVLIYGDPTTGVVNFTGSVSVTAANVQFRNVSFDFGFGVDLTLNGADNAVLRNIDFNGGALRVIDSLNVLLIHSSLEAISVEGESHGFSLQNSRVADIPGVAVAIGAKIQGVSILNKVIAHLAANGIDIG